MEKRLGGYRCGACLYTSDYRSILALIRPSHARYIHHFEFSKVLIHSDHGSQFTSMGWVSFLKHHNLAHSMSRRGNCHDSPVAESFFNFLKRERIRHRVYRSRDEAREDVFDYIEIFYNPNRKHVRNGTLLPVEFERHQKI